MTGDDRGQRRNYAQTADPVDGSALGFVRGVWVGSRPGKRWVRDLDRSGPGRNPSPAFAVRRQSFAPRDDDYTYRHWNSSWVITPDGNGRATGRVYWLAFDPSVEPIEIVDTGVYDDIYVKTADGWKMKQRHAQPDPATQGGERSRPQAD